MRATITATAKYLPKKTLSNYDLEKMVDTTDDWIISRTGIENRHIVDDNEATSDMGAQIANQLLEKSGKSPEDIDLILVATSTPDFPVVSTAALVQDKIGARNAWGYDIVAACTGFVYAMETGARLIESGRYKNIIVIGSDTMSSIIDYTDRNTCVIFGDGGGGVNAHGGSGGKVTGTVLLESGTSYKLVIVGKGGLGGRTSGLVGFGGTGGKGDPTGDPDDLEKYAGDGGGLTGIFKTSVTQANALLIAGGGGGAAGGHSANYYGGVGGGSTGGRGIGNRTGDTGSHGADGGTQTSGGQDSNYTFDTGKIFWGGVGQFDPTGDPDDNAGAVSYTHLTLPTNREV